MTAGNHLARLQEEMKGENDNMEWKKGAELIRGDGVWITGDIELSTESEKYTGVYTSAEGATIHLQKYGSISVSSKGRGIYAKGNFLKQNYLYPYYLLYS